MNCKFRIRHPLRWVDIDSWGVLNNAVYLSLMEQVRYEYFGTLDLLDHGQVSFVIAQVTVRYLAPARMGQVLDLGARVKGFGRTSFTMSFEVQAGEQALATAEAVLVWVGADLRPVPVPDRVREVIGAFEGLD